MKWNTKIHTIQVIVAIFALVQLMNDAIFMALISVGGIYFIGVLEN